MKAIIAIVSVYWLEILLAGLIAGGVLTLRHHWIGVGEDRVQAKWDAAKTKAAADQLKVAKAHAAELQKVREAERAETKRQRDIAADLVEKNHAAIQEIERLDAAVAAGTVRLRQRFTCPSRMPEDSAAASGSDEASGGGFGEADARTAVRIAADGDAAIRQLTACQAILKGLQ